MADSLIAEAVYTSRGGYRVVRMPISKTLRIVTPAGYWLCGTGYHSRVLSFRNFTSACKRADREDKRSAQS